MKEQITRDLKVISEKEKNKKRSSVLEGVNFPRYEGSLKKKKRSSIRETPNFPSLGLISNFTKQHMWFLGCCTVEN